MNADALDADRSFVSARTSWFGKPKCDLQALATALVLIAVFYVGRECFPPTPPRVQRDRDPEVI
ncbi:hypothetical protein [Novipirellula rosea]|uniref:hypothetical protein n=1 Tax=Novipirellula rosea TaxID=1031540 RepID=UPI0031EC1F2B